MSECRFCKMKEWKREVNGTEFRGVCGKIVMGEEGSNISIDELDQPFTEEVGTNYLLSVFHDDATGNGDAFEEYLPISFCPMCGRKLNG